jgi:hypothetical protein
LLRGKQFLVRRRARSVDGPLLVNRETGCRTEVAIAGCTSFFVRLRGRFFVPAYVSVSVARSGGQERSGPGATRSALQRAWRGLRAPDLDRREQGATMVVGGEPEADTNRVVVHSAPDLGAAATWAGGRAARSRPKVAPVSGLAGTARRTGRRCRRRIRTAQRRAVNTDGDTVMLQAIEQSVDQGFFVEQRVPV